MSLCDDSNNDDLLPPEDGGGGDPLALHTSDSSQICSKRKE